MNGLSQPEKHVRERTVIPLKDDNPTHHAPWLTVVLIVINVAVYFLWQGQGTPIEEAVRNFQYSAVPFNITHSADEEQAALALIWSSPSPTRVARQQLQYVTVPTVSLQRRDLGTTRLIFQPIPPWLTLFTSMFMHGSIMHLLGNMLFLWIFGNNIEDATGRFRFLTFYLLTGLVASMGHVLSDSDSFIPTLGASGAISGVLGGYLLLYPKARVLTLVPLPGFFTTFYLPAALFLVIWLFMQLSGVLGEGGGVAWWAHIGGFIAGLVLIKPLESQEHRQRSRPVSKFPSIGSR